MHPNNQHRNGYDFKQLCQALPELEAKLSQTPTGKTSIDFGDPQAVRLLNQALLASVYGVNGWQLPASALCPPVPGRADYLHYVDDYLAGLKGKSGIDIGTGASAIYPLLAVSLFDCNMVASDISKRSLANVKKILSVNPKYAGMIKLRQQSDASKYFESIIRKGEHYDFTLCNPPFFRSEQEAAQANARKTRNLGTQAGLNFGGKHHELWCEGGEIQFIIGMINESKRYFRQVDCFTSLVSRQKSLRPIERQLKKLGAKYDIVDMGIGQKVSRFIAWRWKSE
ncbi:23S rRNA (adenine(1618)-N(6))-methyltransferase RlmF [Salinibius halmophilus]|uniref:23S rRNA (adenine(1618)-N(6))-methyltransferase RlmF n=1 Tax=Salinibius halmophilus TaxID=1853216 RepID=UPI000E66A367|nr:23S rRNA (adenine(1618)-N(6))-methyltransferase RlmF [Salinibius halmophilus]